MIKLYILFVLFFVSLSSHIYAGQPKDKIVSASESCLLEQIHIGESTDKCLNLVYDACIERTKDLSTVGMSACMYEETEEWDKILNDYYRQIIALSNVYQKEFLHDTQKLWIKWRDKNCAYPAILIDGTMAQNWMAACMRDTTFERVGDLKNYLDFLKEN